MRIFRDPLLAVTATAVTGLAVLVGVSATAGGPTPDAPAVEAYDSATAVAVYRARMPQLLNLATGPDERLARFASDLAEFSSEQAQLHHGSDLGEAWSQAATDARSLANQDMAVRPAVSAQVAALIDHGNVIARVQFGDPALITRDTGPAALRALPDPAERLSGFDDDLASTPDPAQPDRLPTAATTIESKPSVAVPSAPTLSRPQLPEPDSTSLWDRVKALFSVQRPDVPAPEPAGHPGDPELSEPGVAQGGGARSTPDGAFTAADDTAAADAFSLDAGTADDPSVDTAPLTQEVP